MARKLSEILLSFPEFQGADPTFLKSNLSDVLNSGDQSRIGKMVSRLQTVPEYQGMSGDDIVKNVSGIIGVQAKTPAQKDASLAPAPTAEKPIVGMGDLRAYESQQGPISTTPIQMAKPQEQEKPRPSYELQPSSVLKSKPVNTAPEGSPASALLNIRPEAVDPSLQQPEIKEAPKQTEISPTKGLVTGAKRMATNRLDAAALILKKSGVKDSEKLIATGAIERPEIVTETLNKFSGPVQALAEKINASITDEEKANEQAAQEFLLEAVKNPSIIKDQPTKAGKAFLTNILLSTPETVSALVPVVGLPAMMAGEGGTWARNAREMGVEDVDLQKQGAISYGIPSGIIEFYTDKLIMAPLGGKNNPLAKGLSKVINKVTRPAFMKLAKPVMETLGASFVEGSEEWLQGNWNKAVSAMMVKKQREKYITSGENEKVKALDEKFNTYLASQDNESAFILGTLAGLGMSAGAKVAGKVAGIKAEEKAEPVIEEKKAEIPVEKAVLVETEEQKAAAVSAKEGLEQMEPNAEEVAKQTVEGLPPDLQPVETVEQIKAKHRPKAPDEIVKPLENLDRQIAEEKDPRVKELLQDNRDLSSDSAIFTEPTKQVIRSTSLFEKSMRKLDEKKIPYAYARIDLANVGGLNELSKTHSVADEHMRRVNGDTLINDVNAAGGLILREGGADELRIVLPGFSKAEAEELIENARQRGLEIAKQRGLDKTVYHPKNTKETLEGFGSLDFAYGVVDGTPGKYGEMDRAADAVQHKMKHDTIDKFKKRIYIKDEEVPNELGKHDEKAGVPAKRAVPGSAEEAKGRPVAEAVPEKSVVTKPEESAAAAKVEPTPVSAATEAEKLIPPDVKKAIEIGKNTDRLLAERKYKLAKRQPRSQKEELFFAKRGYKPYLWDEKTNDLKTSTLGVWAKETIETPLGTTRSGTNKEGKQPWQMTRAEYARVGGEIAYSAPKGTGSHRDFVEDARARGETIPPEVLKDYPWMAADDAIKPYVDGLHSLSDKDLKEEYKRVGDQLNKYARDTQVLLPGGTLNPKAMGTQEYFEISNKFAAINTEVERRKTQPPPAEKKVVTEAKAPEEVAEKPVEPAPNKSTAETKPPAKAEPEALPKEFQTPATELEPGDLIATKTAAGVLRVKRPWKKGQTLFATTDMDSPIEKASTDRTFHAKAIESKPFYLMEKGTKETPKEAEKVKPAEVASVPQGVVTYGNDKAAGPTKEGVVWSNEYQAYVERKDLPEVSRRPMKKGELAKHKLLKKGEIEFEGHLFGPDEAGVDRIPAKDIPAEFTAGGEKFTKTELKSGNFELKDGITIKSVKPDDLISIDKPEVKPPEAEQPEAQQVISEEDYLASKGASRQGIGDAALHKNLPYGRARDQAIENQAKKDRELLKRREELRAEYLNKIKSGEIRKPTREENLIQTARGDPDNESVRAARRLLEKRGIDWRTGEPPAFLKSPDQLSLFPEPGVSTDVSPLITSAEIEFPLAMEKFVPKGYDIRYKVSSNYFMRNSEGTPVGIGRFKDMEAACISVDRKNQRATIFLNPRANPNEIAQIFKHEMRHFGLRMLADANPNIMNQASELMAQDKTPFMEKLIILYPYASKQTLLEEWLIRRLGQHEDGITRATAEQGIIKRVWEAFKRWLNNALIKYGFKEPKTRAEIFDNIVSEMRDLKPREEVEVTGEAQPAFARLEPADTFFSPTLRAVEGLKQEKGVVPQLQSMIRNGQLKKAEVEWMGLKEWLDANPQATKTQVADFVRSNIAQKAVTQVEAGEVATFSGPELKIGGEWAANLYDKQIPDIMNKIGKKFGTKVDLVTLGDPEKGMVQESFPITPSI